IPLPPSDVCSSAGIETSVRRYLPLFLLARLRSLHDRAARARAGPPPANQAFEEPVLDHGREARSGATCVGPSLPILGRAATAPSSGRNVQVRHEDRTSV